MGVPPKSFVGDKAGIVSITELLRINGITFVGTIMRCVLAECGQYTQGKRRIASPLSRILFD
jgi:hypothetical protein